MIFRLVFWPETLWLYLSSGLGQQLIEIVILCFNKSFVRADRSAAVSDKA